MGDLGRDFRRADTLLWFGNEAIHIWDERKKTESCIQLLGPDEWIPYVPKYYYIWEEGERYREELRGLLGTSPLSKRRILAATPEDITVMEAAAIEDFICAALGGGVRYGGLSLYSQSQLLCPPGSSAIAMTRSCRCYCASLVRDGEIVERLLLDVNDCTRDELLRAVRDFHSRYHDNAIEVYYPQTEEDWLLMGLGAPVEFEGIVERWAG